MSLLYGDVLAAGGTKPPAGYEQDTPMPLYEGISMFTGQGLFPRFGTNVVSATSIVPGVDAFASAGPDEIVIVNTNAKKEKISVRGSARQPAARGGLATAPDGQGSRRPGQQGHHRRERIGHLHGHPPARLGHHPGPDHRASTASATPAKS